MASTEPDSNPLTKLLRLRYHGQVEAPTRFDGSDLGMKDGDSCKVSILAGIDTSKLPRAFLDKLAELMANEKSGHHVSASLMTTDSQGQVRVFVARKSKFRANDEAFLSNNFIVLIT